MPKNAHTHTHTIALISHTSKVILKILQAMLQQYVNHEVPDGNWGTIYVYVPFSRYDLSMAEDKLGSFSEDPELFFFFF